MTSGLDANRAGVQAVDLADSWHADAFGRLRVSDIYSVFDSKLIYDLQPSWWEDTVSGAGAAVTYNAARSSATLTTGATTAANKAERQTRRYFQYVPGKSLVVFLTGVIGNGVTNCRKRWGYFDSNNGVFFQQDGDTISVVRRSDVGSVGTPTEDEVEQAAWNIDPLDGTGPSGIELDLTQANIFVIDLQWLGVGRVRMSVDIDGEIVPCHEFLNANALTSIYMRAADLPVRYSITNTGTATGTGSMEVICTSVAQEGGYGQRANEYPFSANTGIDRYQLRVRAPLNF